MRYLLIPAVCLSSAFSAWSAPLLKEESTQQAALVAKLEKSDPKDPRLFFLRSQQEILDRLAEKYDKRTDADAIWLKEVVHLFMAALHRAFEGKIDDKKLDGTWPDVASGKLAGGWWRVALDSSAKAPFHLAGPFPKPSKEDIAAFPLMLAHIWYDLRVAMITHGPGTDPMWKEVEEIIKAVWSDKKELPRSMVDGQIAAAGVFPSLKPFNPIELRNTVRGQVIAFLKTKGKNGPTTGLQEKSTPPAEAFPVFGK
jgi:hypothetical protein